MFIEKNGTFQLKIHICIGITDKYNYGMDYLDNVARNFTKNIPATLSIRKAKTR